MAVSNLRKIRHANGPREILLDVDNDQIEIISVSKKTAKALCDDYPHDGQDIFEGTLVFREESKFGRGRELRFEYEFRSGSEIFIINSDVDVSIDDILFNLNSQTPSNFEIYRSITPNREKLWEFVKSADQLVDLTVINSDGEEIESDNIKEKGRPIEEYPIEDATLSFNYKGKSILTKYTSGSVNVRAESSEEREYIIQLFERDVLDTPVRTR